MPRWPRHADARRLKTAAAARAAAFSLVEILVVIAIIGILLAVVFKGGTALIGSSKSRETSALLKKLDLAIDEYKREVDTSRIPRAKYVFNGSPPDDLRVFLGQPVTLGGCSLQMRNTGAILRNNSPIPVNQLIDPRDADGRLSVPPDQLLHADIRAMVLAMRLYSPKAKAVLDTIDAKYWATPDETLVYQPSPNAPTIRLDYLVDAWGQPLEYYATCICDPSQPLTPREIVSNAFVHENNDGGVAASYGPDGAEQFAADMIAAEGDSSLVADFYQEIKAGGKGLLNHRLNSDNLYSSDFFTNRIRQAGP